MAIIDVTIPDIGDFDEVAVIELLVKAGDKAHMQALFKPWRSSSATRSSKVHSF